MSRFARRLSVIVVVAASVILQQSQTIAHAATVRTVALSGQQAPGTPSGVNYNGFNSSLHSPVLNDAGQTAFFTRLTGSGVVLGVNDTGIWSEGSGSLALVARQGSHAPGTPSGVNYSSFTSSFPVLNDPGVTAFFALLTGSGVDSANDRGIWSERSGSLALVARTGNQAPGLPSGVNFLGISVSSIPFIPSTALNDAGQSAFRATLTGSGVDGTNNHGIWSEGSGSLALVVRAGSQVPGTLSGVNYLALSPPVLNDAGQTAFFALLTGSGVDSTNNSSIWSEGSGNLALVAREGHHAPGTPSGVNYGDLSSINSYVLNNAGQTAFAAFLTGSGVNSTNTSGIWSEGSGSLALVARSGSQAPGMPNGVNFVNFAFSRPLLNDAGQTSFFAYLTGTGVDSTNDWGIWSEGSGSLGLVARVGSQAPGTPSGVNYSNFQERLVLNNAGQIAFRGSITGNGVVVGTNSSGIWATDRTDVLQLIVRTGDPLEVAPGDFRTISLLEFVGETGNSDGRPSGFNNLGQLAFRASFTDGSSGVFVSNRVAIPEPNSLLLAALVVAGLLNSRRSLRRCFDFTIVRSRAL